MQNKTIEQDLWSQEIKNTSYLWHKIYAWCIIIIYPMWTIFDYLLARDYWMQFMILRFSGSFIILIYLIFYIKFKLSSIVLGYLMSLIMLVSIAFMMPFTGNSMWYYAMGFSTAFITTGFLLYWKPVHTIIMTLISLSSYVLCISTLGNVTLNQAIGGGAFLIPTIAIISAVMGWNRFRLSKREFFLRMELSETNKQLTIARDSLWGEMELAKKIQSLLLPENPSIKDYEISTFIKPAMEIGGDYYDIINSGGFHWIIIGDVSGHGVTAGLIMMMVHISIHTVLTENPNLGPSQLLQRVNTVITTNIKKFREDKYMTITAIAYMKNGQFFFSGLHQDILLYRANAQRVEEIETSGMWIGIVNDLTGMLDNKELQMNVNDILLLYTDGITEAWKDINPAKVPEKNQMFGANKLKDILYSQGNKSPDDIKRDLIKELQNYHTDDDITFVILKRLH